MLDERVLRGRKRTPMKHSILHKVIMSYIFLLHNGFNILSSCYIFKYVRALLCAYPNDSHLSV